MLNEHEQRREVVAEMHLRRWPVLSVPSTIVQIVKILDPDEREAETQALDAIPAETLDADNNPRHFSGLLAGGIAFTWERHSEASTITLFLANAGLPESFADAAGDDVSRAVQWAASLPGRAVRATQMVVVPSDADADAILQRQEIGRAHV